MSQAFHFIVDDNGIGTLRIDIPGEKVNTLSPTVLEELDRLIDSTIASSEAKAVLVTSGKKGNFIAGADVKEFVKIRTAEGAEEMARRGQGVFNKLVALPMPTVAIIDGACMGGGTELALACTYRIAVDEPKTVIALPEVKLGLIPGWGGTQRLPRLVGLMNAMDMILSGKNIKARKALKMGLVDAVVARAFVHAEAEKFVRQILCCKGKSKVLQRRKPKGWMPALLEKNPLGRYLIFRKGQSMLMKQTKGHYPAPLAALHVLKDTVGVSLKDGLALEAKVIASMFESEVTANLIHLFFGMQTLKKDPGLPEGASAKPVRKAAVVGAGIMGGGIAWLFSKGDIPVRMKDIDWGGIAHGFKSAQDVYTILTKKRKYTRDQANVKMHLITGGLNYSGFADTDLVVEAVVEDMSIKHKVLKEVEREVRPDTIIASNTSSLSITEMGSVLEHPERFIGLHFFNPVSRMPLVEVIPGERSDPDALATAVELMHKLGKNPIVVKDSPGFLVNRILLPYLNEAGWLLQEGVDFVRIDNLMTSFGMPMGPFELLDEIGLDVAYKAARTLEKSFGERARVPEVLAKAMDAGFLGNKADKGFYIGTRKKKQPNKAMSQQISRMGMAKQKRSNTEIVDRLVLSMVNEAAMCLEEGIVNGTDQLDVAMIFGTGFPPFRGGPLRYADSRGIEDVVTRLVEFQSQRDARFAPCNLLLQMKKQGRKFADGVEGIVNIATPEPQEV